MAKKFDFDFKKFFVEKGEFVGLVVAGALMAILVFVGISSGLGKSSPLPKLKSTAADLDRRVAGSTVDVKKLGPDSMPNKPEWEDPDPEIARMFEWLTRYNLENNKRQNPQILGLGDYRVNVVKAGVRRINFTVDKDVDVLVSSQGGALGDTSNPSFAEVIQPVRMVVITATFPYSEQLKQFKSALRLKDGDDKNEENLPRFLGFFVYRRTTLPNGKVKLFEVDGKKIEWETLDLDSKYSKVKTLLASSAEMEPRDKKLAAVSFRGLVMPRPALAHTSSYPEVTLKGIKDIPIATEPKEPQSGTKYKPIGWDTLSDDLKDKLSGKVEVFDPNLRIYLDPADKKNAEKIKQQPLLSEEQKNFKGNDCLVRVIDVDVQPGYTYDYSIVVRVANPNFGKIKKVAAKGFAKVPVLLSGHNYVPNVVIPQDNLLYVVDEKELSPKDFAKNAMLGAETKPVGLGVALQVHRWVDEIPNQESRGRFNLGEWLIAERLVFKRGDPIERRINLQVPIWIQAIQGYELLGKEEKKTAKKKKSTVEVLFTTRADPELPPAFLVDFRGGQQGVQIPKKGFFKDNSAVDVLILNPDGTLIVRNSLTDAEEAPIGTDRQDRLEKWQDRINKLKGVDPKKGRGKDKGKKKGTLDK